MKFDPHKAKYKKDWQRKHGISTKPKEEKIIVSDQPEYKEELEDGIVY
jgi:hypothetical protein